MSRQLLWSSPATREFRKLEPQLQDRILAALDRALDGAGDIRPLTNTDPPQLRLRVGDYRVRFTLTTTQFLVLSVRHRLDAYR